MDTMQILEQLEQALRHVSDGARRLTRQRALVKRLARQGCDTGTAEVLLQQLEKAQALHVAGRDRIRAELGEAIGALLAESRQ